MTVTTLDSNVWSAGDGYDYRLTPTAAGGTAISVDVVHHAQSLKGRLVGLVRSLNGARMLREDMRRVLEPLERR